jgi:tetratricopeptide (TPR) repeat protein
VEDRDATATDHAIAETRQLKEGSMRFNRKHLVLTTALVFGVAIWSGCNRTNSTNTAAAASSDGKIPITTKSEEAKNEFVQGRDLTERLQGQESIQHFDKAIALDPEFASAELARANNSPTAKEFFEHMNKAVSLADKASEGEKLLILGSQAGVNGDVVKQKEYWEKLAAAYPNDERAQINLANYYSGQQEVGAAIEHYKKTAEVAPNYSPTYNALGYAYRQQGDYANAELAFKKYVELIPGDPNPYDSYAELLLKMGRFEESIAQYRKALSLSTHFPSSHFGIAADLMYMGKAAEAEAEMQKIADEARNDGELRTALFGLSVVAADSGNLNQAAQEMDKEFAVAEKKNDVASMAADLQAKGNILAQIPKYEEAKQQFDRSFQMIQGSSQSQEIKENSRLLHEYNLAAIAIGMKDYAAAKTHAEEFRKGAEASNNALQIQQAHQLAGRIALAQKDYSTAIAELEQANQQNPQNLFRLSQAYLGKGDSAKAHEFSAKAAEFNSLPQLPYAFIRVKAQKAAAGKPA